MNFAYSFLFLLDRCRLESYFIADRQKERDDYSLFVLSLCQLKPNGQLAKSWCDVDANVSSVTIRNKHIWLPWSSLSWRKWWRLAKKWKTKWEWYAKLYYVDLFHLCSRYKNIRNLLNYGVVLIETPMNKVYNIKFLFNCVIVLSSHDMTTT